MYENFKSAMKKLDPKIDCNSNVGGICITQTSCVELQRRTGQHKFQLAFTENTDMVFVMPLKAFMRETEKNYAYKKGTCKILVSNIGPEGYNDGIILGDVFFQQFEAVFSGSNMRVVL